jgi:hypothetical protein
MKVDRQGTLWVTFESGEYAGQEKNPPRTVEELHKDSTERTGLKGFPLPEDTTLYKKELEKFLESYDPKTTDVWWYNNLWLMSGSAGYAIIRKGTDIKVVEIYTIVVA